jgi:hypothetical protein
MDVFLVEKSDNLSRSSGSILSRHKSRTVALKNSGRGSSLTANVPRNFMSTSEDAIGRGPLMGVPPNG